MQPETKFKEKVFKFFKGEGLWYFKSQEVSVCGIPDVIGCTRLGRIFAIELKRDEDVEQADALQKYNLRKIRQKGGIAFSLNPDEDWKKKIIDNGIFERTA